jgi:hypothetical protein
MTTIPSRIKNIGPCVESLFAQTIAPHNIFINIPRTYRRFDEVIRDRDIPQFDNPSVTVVRCEDYGPGTKVLGSLQRFDADALVVLVDDDCTYQDYMIESFVEQMTGKQRISCSFYTFGLGEKRKYTIGQAADGFAIRAKDLDRLDIFYRVISANRYLFFHDDLWISFYLALRKIDVVSLAPLLQGENGLIYSIYNDSDSLIGLSGELSREQLELNGLNYLERRRALLHLLVNVMPQKLARYLLRMSRSAKPLA